MRAGRPRVLLCGVAALALAAACPRTDTGGHGGDPSEPAVEERIPGLQSRIEQWRGLAFTEPVVAEWKEPKQEKIAGWYDPETKRLYLAPSARGRFGEGVLLHELFHALQDQHYDIRAMHARAGNDDERQAVVDTLIEGEAMFAVMELLDYDFETLAEHAQKEREAEGGGPTRGTVYLEGARYVRAVRDACGWDGVDRVFRDPPPSRAVMRAAWSEQGAGAAAALPCTRD